MKPVLALIIFAHLATPALAHEGLHHHPHGVDILWAVLALAAGIAIMGLSWLRGRR